MMMISTNFMTHYLITPQKYSLIMRSKRKLVSYKYNKNNKPSLCSTNKRVLTIIILLQLQHIDSELLHELESLIGVVNDLTEQLKGKLIRVEIKTKDLEIHKTSTFEQIDKFFD